MGRAGAVHVAVGVMQDSAGRVLVARRDTHRHQGGRWEFPGGKIEPGETPFSALERELAEELGVAVAAASSLIRIPYDYGDRQVVLDVMRVTAYAGEPRGLEGQPLTWAAVDALDPAVFPAANRPIITALRLPSIYVISPDCHDPGAWLAQLDTCLAGGARLIQFRVRGDARRRDTLAREAVRRCHAGGAVMLVNGDAALAEASGADGVHLNARQLWAYHRRPLPGVAWVGASCHDDAELARAADLGVDFAVFGPVAPTASHPGATPLGWPGFTDGVAAASLPVYALGGMTRADTDTAIAHGGQGVAGIRGFWPGLSS
jgi:8-oxo-dGTP diphosphatase